MVRAENDEGKWGGGEHEVWGMEAVKRKRRGGGGRLRREWDGEGRKYWWEVKCVVKERSKKRGKVSRYPVG